MTEGPRHGALSQGPVPQLLYHYTGVDGLLGILKQGKIWATDYRYLNDSSEILFGGRLYNQAVDENISKKVEDLRLRNSAMPTCENDDYYSGFKNHLIEDLKLEGNLNAYVASFSEPLRGEGYGDDLSQWRGYSKGSCGFALGFDLTKILGIENSQPNNQRPVIGPVPCKYHLPGAVNPFLDLVPELIESYSQQGVGTFAKLIPVVIELISAKNPAFSGEREWRIALLTQREYRDVEFRPGKAGPIPFLSYNLGAEGEALLPLQRIVVGPASENSISVAGVQRLLFSLGYNATEVVPSRIPYRDW